MTNDISKRNETAPSTNTETNPWLAYGNSVASSRIVGKLLKFSKFGEFLAGEEGEDVPSGTELIVHCDEMLVGWIKWSDSRPVDHIMGRLADGFKKPDRTELGDMDKTLWELDEKNQPRDPWQDSVYTVMYDPETGQIYTYATSSKGGRKANGIISKAYGQRARMAPDMFPVIRLGWYEYDHRDKSLGKIRNPQFEVIGWTHRGKIDEALQAAVGEAAAQADADHEAVDYYEEKPAPKQVSKPTQTEKPRLRGRETSTTEIRDNPRQPQPLSSAARKPRF